MTVSTRSQEDGARTYLQVRALPPDHNAREYDALCQSLPLLLLRQGLAQTVSWLFAKRGDEGKKTVHGILLGQIRDILMPGEEEEKFVEQVLSAEMGRYRELTHRALELCEWYRRFSRATRDEQTANSSAGGKRETT